MIWDDRYLIVQGVAFCGVAWDGEEWDGLPDPRTGGVEAVPERELTLALTASGLSLAQLPPGITATRITINGGEDVAVPNAVADIIRNLLPGQRITISENYTLSTGRVWVGAIVINPFKTTVHAVETDQFGTPIEQWHTYSGFEALVLGGPA
ncbi:hypothetical protein [Deinococcus soli (ex Cha et al. 2016)]|nr:hypothetical protein [Deinococcus soli (ex Cha et al. 2016)]GGB64413.1 hypothetical protein GCM10008019_20620 [Deinococcus soli (ex Cha et al. 2016)]